MINTSLAKAGPFSCDGVQTSFDFEFPVLDSSHVAVYVNDSKIATGFTVTRLATGGRVAFTTAPAAGAIVAIVRDVPVTQGVDLQNNTAFMPEVIETALDRLTMICQQLKETFTRTLTLPPTSEFDQNTIYEQFANLVGNAETWAAQAQTGAVTARNAANDASAKSAVATAKATEASAAAANANSAAFSAANASGNAINAAGEIQEIAGQATLNKATLLFGEWGAEGIFISYNEWTNAESLGSVDSKIASHNDSSAAHADIRQLTQTHNSNATAHADIRHSILLTDGKFNTQNIRTLANTRCWISSPITPVRGTRSTVAHNLNLGAAELARTFADVRLKCVVANNNYKVGDYATAWGMEISNYCINLAATPLLEQNYISVCTGNFNNGICGVNATTGAPVTLLAAQWAYEFRIWY